MKPLTYLLLALFSFNSVVAQTDDVNTLGDNSPAVIAQNFSATYGVRADAIQAILWIYEAEGYDVERRKRATEQILNMYAQSPEKQQKDTKLSQASRRKMGIANAPEIADALEWDLFARNHYLSTAGHNSPAVLAKGDVNIWYGISPKTLRALAAQLEKNKTDLTNFEVELADQAKKYEELKTELETYSSKEVIYLRAEALLEEGKLEEAEQLIESDYHASKKRQAYKGYIFGKTKELLIKYEEAAVGYRDAVFLDPKNSNYLLAYAYNENTRANYDVAIEYYQKSIAIDTIVFGNMQSSVANDYMLLGDVLQNKGEYDLAIEYYKKALAIDTIVYPKSLPNIATNLNFIGTAYRDKGEYDLAIEYYKKALAIDTIAYGMMHPDVAAICNNLGSAWVGNGKYDRAIAYFEKALAIDTILYGMMHPSTAINYCNLGDAWQYKGEYDLAIEYYKKALAIDTIVYGMVHPNVAIRYFNLGSAWDDKGEYDMALALMEKALAIDTVVFGIVHPNVAVDYSGLGLAWQHKEDYDRAITFYEKALAIDTVVFGLIHPSIPIRFNNLGSAWKAKGEYDRAIAFFEKALAIDTVVFGMMHQNIGIILNNIGDTYNKKNKYDDAIAFFEKALAIDTLTIGYNHPNVAIVFYNLGDAYSKKGEYENSIVFFEKCQDILPMFFEPQHALPKKAAKSLSLVCNNRGMEFCQEKKYTEALSYFEKGLVNAEAAEDWPLSITCLNNIGSTKKQIGGFAGGLESLDKGIARAEELDKKSGKAEYADIIRRMRYHKVGCLAGLGQKKEAKALASKIHQEAIEVNDTRTLEDLKNDRYNKKIKSH